jgi:hypothetical protein
VTRLLDYNLLETLHVVAVALWLGTDIAAAAVLRRSVDEGHSPNARTEMVRLWEDLDLGPRAASIILLTLGITLAYLGRWGFTTASELVILGGSVLLGAAWLLAVVFRFWVNHPRQGAERSRWQLRTANAARTADLWLRVVVTLALAVTAVISLGADGGPIAANWLSIKLILVAVAVALTFGTRLMLPSMMGWSPQGPVDKAPAVEAGRRPVVLSLTLTAVGWVCIAVVIWLSIAKV